MPSYIRTDKYDFVKPITWNVIPEVEDNNFQPLIDNINLKIRVSIAGREGTGKSSFFNKTFANINKAARIIDGSTSHKLINHYQVRKH